MIYLAGQDLARADAGDRLFGDLHRWNRRVTGGDRRHDGRIRNADAGNGAQPQTPIDDRGIVRTHPAGPHRMKDRRADIARGARQVLVAAHQGTGQVLDIVPHGAPAYQAGYNDVGILTAPDGSTYTVAVMIGRTLAPVPQRMDMMHGVVRAIAGYHEMVAGPGAGADAAGDTLASR